MKKLFATALATGVLAVGTASAQNVIFTADFETDQSANFTAQNEETTPATNDFVLNYQYDYSTHVQANGAALAIGAAPNSSGGTTGVRMEANNNDATAEAAMVQIFPNVSIPAGNDWSIQFDAWINYNGDAGGGSGSTEFGFWGAAADSTGPIWNDGSANTPNGFGLWTTGEGGAGQDYRYYDGDGSAALTRDDAKPNYNGVNEVNNLDASWQAFFPQVSAPQQTAGSAGKRWVTITIDVDQDTTPPTITVDYNPADTVPTSTQVAQFQTSAGVTPNTPYIGYTDIFTSIASPAADNFIVIDNIIITDLDAAPSSVTEWSIYD